MSFREIVEEQQRRIRREWAELAKTYPHWFDAGGRPVVAALPPLPEYAATRPEFREHAMLHRGTIDHERVR